VEILDGRMWVRAVKEEGAQGLHFDARVFNIASAWGIH
jgi:hypothetical protein